MTTLRPTPWVSVFLGGTMVCLGAVVRVCAQGEPPAPVVVDVAAEIHLVPTKPVLGATEAKRRSVLAASIEGYVVEYLVEEGAWVKSGDVIARLRDDILKLRVTEAKAGIREIQALHRQAQLDLERARKLIGRDAVTQKELDASVTAEASLALRLPQAEARLAVIQADLAKKTVRAPYAGQIVREHTQVGEWVTRGGAVATIVDLSTVYVRVNVPEREIRFVRRGQQVEVRIPAAYPGDFKGKVVSVLGEGDAEARTFAVRIEVDNDGHIKAGMSATVDVPAGAPRKALAVSKDAMIVRGRQSFVFVVGDGGQADQRRVEVGSASGSRFEILQGLRAGERVVVRGNELLRPGRKVRLVESAAPTAPAKKDVTKNVPEEGEP